MSSSYRVQTDPRAKRTYRLAKFRDPVPALSDPSTTVKMTPKTGELGEQEWGLDFGGERPFNGTRERVSGIGGKQSGYVLFRVDPSTGVLTVLPVSEWYDFRPEMQHETLTLEDAEKSLEKGRHDGGRLLKKDRDAAKDAANDANESGAGAAQAADSEDEFDDGADPRFKEDLDENGREGLDMENEDDMFDDDDDDVFDEDDDQAVAGREQAKQWGAGAGTLAGADAAFEDEDEPEEEVGAAEGSDEYKATAKEVLRAEKRRQREQNDDDDDDDGSEDDEGKEGLDALLKEGEPVAKAEGADEVKEETVKEEAASSRASSRATTPTPGAAPGKRKPSPVQDGQPEENSRASKQQKKQRVQERDVVLLIHEHGSMQLKDLVAKFKPLMAKDKDSEKEDKGKFMAIVKKVAKLVPDSDPKVLVLNESTLDQYGLQAKA